MRSNLPAASHRAGTFTERARRAQIIDCAVDALAELGYAGASVAEIAGRAGVSKGVVSYYFASKDELLEQLVADVYMRAGEAIEARLAQEGTAAARLRGYLEANLEYIAAHPREIRAAAEIVVNLRRADGALHFGAGSADPVVEHLAELLRCGQRSGDFRAFDASSVALILRAAIDAASGQLVANPHFDIDTYRQELVVLAQHATEGSTS
jgi:TetR/AcrR family transcriptional regulator, fatty acid metabolism regulator protein